MAFRDGEIQFFSPTVFTFIFMTCYLKGSNTRRFFSSGSEWNSKLCKYGDANSSQTQSNEILISEWNHRCHHHTRAQVVYQNKARFMGCKPQPLFLAVIIMSICVALHPALAVSCVRSGMLERRTQLFYLFIWLHSHSRSHLRHIKNTLRDWRKSRSVYEYKIIII